MAHRDCLLFCTVEILLLTYLRQIVTVVILMVKLLLHHVLYLLIFRTEFSGVRYCMLVCLRITVLPPLLLPLYFNLEVPYFLIKRKKWMVCYCCTYSPVAAVKSSELQ